VIAHFPKDGELRGLLFLKYRRYLYIYLSEVVSERNFADAFDETYLNKNL
jgi:hypothetical protein